MCMVSLVCLGLPCMSGSLGSTLSSNATAGIMHIYLTHRRSSLLGLRTGFQFLPSNHPSLLVVFFSKLLLDLNKIHLAIEKYVSVASLR